MYHHPFIKTGMVGLLTIKEIVPREYHTRGKEIQILIVIFWSSKIMGDYFNLFYTFVYFLYCFQ